MAIEPQPAGTKSDSWSYWHAELEQARKVTGYDQWQTRARKIVKRYRDERVGTADYQDSANTESSKFNILWSNVQTLMPALFSKSPKPVVERRYLDSDDVGRTATVILERTLMYELDDGLYAGSLRKAVLDRLLPGRGVVWVRYEPKFTPMPGKTQEATEGQPEPAKTDGGEQQEEVASESVPVDYIDWNDFLTSPARTWEECRWIAKRVYMTRGELVKRFPKYGAQITLDFSPIEANKQQPGVSAAETPNQNRAKIWEIWDKAERKVRWVAETWSDAVLDEKDDPLRLEGFYPCPKPLFATLTNDSLVPVPDYYEYQDQAAELDDLTARIAAVTKAIKVAGVYDASVPELQRMFEEGFENRLVPCDDMAQFSQKAGPNGMAHIWLLPIADLVKVLNELYLARDQVKQSLYEITGISDIVRGTAAQGGAKTATEQRIKGQFASMRLNDMQMEVARFARDTLCIMGEIISEHFDPMTLFMVSGYEQWAKDQWPPEAMPAPPQPPQMGHNGGPPMDAPQAPPLQPGMPPQGMPPQGAPQQGMPPQPMGMMAPPPPDPAAISRAKAVDMFKQAVALLKNEKLRGFRIEIETDSLIEADRQETQKARAEFLAAVGQFLQQAVPLGQGMPEFMPLLGKMLLFGVRGFAASRDLESAFEQMVDQLQKKAQNPPPKPPSPDEIKMQMMQQQQQAENARMAAQAQMDQQNFEREQQAKAADFQMEQQRQQFDMEMERQRFALEQQKQEMQLAFQERSLALKAQSEQHAAGVKAEALEHGADVQRRIAEAKAEQAKETEAA